MDCYAISMMNSRTMRKRTNPKKSSDAIDAEVRDILPGIVLNRLKK